MENSNVTGQQPKKSKKKIIIIIAVILAVIAIIGAIGGIVGVVVFGDYINQKQGEIICANCGEVIRGNLSISGDYYFCDSDCVDEYKEAAWY